MPQKDPAQRKAYDREYEKRRPKRYRPRRYHTPTAKAWREAHPDYAKGWFATHPDSASIGSKRWREANPQKARAQHKCGVERRAGRLLVLPCEMCGAEQVQAHHAFGYSDDMALAVWWLCRRDHMAMHAAIRNQEKPPA